MNQQRASNPGKTDPMLGRVVAGRYRLEARAGEGGMGVVYRARHVLIDRVVALKLIRPDLRGETHLRAWMLREARAANRVDHAHIIDIHDIGETEEGELYLVMEYLVGTSLSSELARGPMALARGVDILEQMCAALARAHDLGVVHRDLKSDNILLSTRGGRKDFVKILDFGLAHLAMDPRLAPKGAVFGTPEYMAPEQARGEEANAQSDLYALGVLFFEMLTGQLPFRIERPRDAPRDAAHRAAPPKPRSIKPDILPAAEAMVLQAAREGPAQALPGRPPPPRRAEGAPALAAQHAVGGRDVGRRRGASAAPAAAVAGRHRVGEPRRALLADGEPLLPAGERAAGDSERGGAGVGSRVARDAARGRGREPHAEARVARASRSGAARGDRAQGRGARARRVARASRRERRAARGDAAARARAGGGEGRGARRRQAADSVARRARRKRCARSSSERARRRRSSTRGASTSRSASRRPSVKDQQARDLRRQIDELRAQLVPLRRGARRGSRRRAARRSPRGRARGSRSRRRSARSRRSS